MTHDDLVNSLADHLTAPERMVWRDMQLGPSGSVRPDVYTMYKSYVRPYPMAYECKISASDYLSDVNSGKWQGYLRYACGVIFACPAGLIPKEVLPPHCGLIILHDSGTWRMAKKPILNPVVVPQETLIKLLIDGVKRVGPRHQAQTFQEYTRDEANRKRYGESVAKVIRDVARAQQEIEWANNEAERIRKEASATAATIKRRAEEEAGQLNPVRAELCGLLGIPLDSSNWTLQAKLSDLRRDIKRHPAQAAHMKLTSVLQAAIEQFGYKETT